jgi:hypothetical protein
MLFSAYYSENTNKGRNFQVTIFTIFRTPYSRAYYSGYTIERPVIQDIKTLRGILFRIYY